jgi:hypothetical protein
MSFLSMVSSRLAGGYYRRRFFANAMLRSPGGFAGVGRRPSGKFPGGCSRHLDWRERFTNGVDLARQEVLAVGEVRRQEKVSPILPRLLPPCFPDGGAAAPIQP